MATARKPDRGSLSRRNPSLAARAAAGAAAAVESVTSVGPSKRVDGPSTELVNKLLLALGIRALVTGIALTLVAPTVPVFVGVNLLFAVPVVARHLYRRRTDTAGRLGHDPSPTVRSRVRAAVRDLVDRSSRDSNRL